MKNMFNTLNILNIFKCCKNKSSAHVVDGKLILSFPGAQTPVLWQMDLTTAKSAALEVQADDKDSAVFHLVSKYPDGQITPIAPFENREDALKGLLVAAKALEKAHGQIRSAAANEQNPGTGAYYGPKKRGFWKTALLVAACIVTAYIIFLVLLSLGSAPPQNVAYQSSSAEQSAGVPVSADDFLKGR